MLRPDIARLAEFDYEQPITLRRAVEWYKNILTTETGTVTGEEMEYMNKQWGSIIRKLAEVQGVPEGFLSYMTAELVQYELRLLRTAEQELQEAAVG